MHNLTSKPLADIEIARSATMLPIGEVARRLAIEEDDLGVSYYKDETIDLGEVVREQFYLALPMKPLCRETCKGLCPVCGANRNRETCTCETTWVDPRLEALKALKKG